MRNACVRAARFAAAFPLNGFRENAELCSLLQQPSHLPLPA